MSERLEQLGPSGFQDLAAALALATFGAGVEVMGPGRDGGRDLYYRGSLTWDESNVPETWDGYTVFQVKQKATLAARPEDNASWLWGEVRKELDAWADPAGRRTPLPDQLVFVTNVPLTPTPGVGGHDQMSQSFQNYVARLEDSSRDVGDVDAGERIAKLQRIRCIKRLRFWDRTKLIALLNAHPGVRRAFPAFLTAADVFARLGEVTNNLPLDELEPALRSHARSTLLSDGLIYFAEAGHGDNSGIQVHDVAIDLPILHADEEHARESLVSTVMAQAERVLKPSVPIHQGPRHLIVTGDPGNGKTTISKFIVQAYRASLVNGSTGLSAAQRQVVEGVSTALGRFGSQLPRHRRWPIRIDLADYAQERGHLIDDTLLRWIAERISARSDLGTVTPRALLSWQRQWPWIVVLDGLDEVTEPSVRRTVIERVVDFVNEAEASDCDLFLVLTTRPVGYTENIAPDQFQTVELADLTVEEAVRYGKGVSKVRLGDDIERYENVAKQLDDAAESESLRNLLRTPLQVLILSIIIDNSAGNLAPDRYSLFWGYYDTVFKRELAKKTTLRTLLRDHGPQIQQLHERVGFTLQLRSEGGDRSFAALTVDELKDIIWAVLQRAGHKPGDLGNSLVADIYRAATERLVLIAPRGSKGFGFDVRSLQELMAAKHLTNGAFDQVADRLRKVAASPHWRNTWIFAAGAIFAARQEHQLPLLVELVEGIDDHAAERLGRVVAVGPRLALALLDDGMARSWPTWRDRLLQHGLRVLEEPSPTDLPSLARAVVRYADTGTDQRRAVAAGIRGALSGNTTTRRTTEALEAELPYAEAQLRVRPETKGLSFIRRKPNVALTADPIADWTSFGDVIAKATLDPSDSQTLQQAVDALQALRTSPTDKDNADTLATALMWPTIASVLEEALQHVAVAEPSLFQSIRDRALPDVYRQPTSVGESSSG